MANNEQRQTWPEVSVQTQLDGLRNEIGHLHQADVTLEERVGALRAGLNDLAIHVEMHHPTASSPVDPSASGEDPWAEVHAAIKELLGHDPSWAEALIAEEAMKATLRARLQPTRPEGESDKPCPGCAKGEKPVLLDEHGTLSSVSGHAGRLGHAVDDFWWYCDQFSPPEPAPQDSPGPEDPHGHRGKGGVWSPHLGPCCCAVCEQERRRPAPGPELPEAVKEALTMLREAGYLGTAPRLEATVRSLIERAEKAERERDTARAEADRLASACFQWETALGEAHDQIKNLEAKLAHHPTVTEEEIRGLRKGSAFFRSAIKSGEPWDTTCEKVYHGILALADQLENAPAHDCRDHVKIEVTEEAAEAFFHEVSAQRGVCSFMRPEIFRTLRAAIPHLALVPKEADDDQA